MEGSLTAPKEDLFGEIPPDPVEDTIERPTDEVRWLLGDVSLEKVTDSETFAGLFIKIKSNLSSTWKLINLFSLHDIWNI